MFVYGHEEDSMKDIKAIKKMKLHRNGKNSILNWLNFFLTGSDLRFEGETPLGIETIPRGVFDL